MIEQPTQAETERREKIQDIAAKYGYSIVEYDAKNNVLHIRSPKDIAESELEKRIKDIRSELKQAGNPMVIVSPPVSADALDAYE